MSTCRTVCQHTSTVLSRSKRPSTTSSAGLWITDAQLEDAFARFLRVSQTQRRYQSNVPGPLEARRRETRRRRASFLNQVSSVDPSYSDAHNFGFGLSNGQRAREPNTTANAGRMQAQSLAHSGLAQHPCLGDVSGKRIPADTAEASQQPWTIFDDPFGLLPRPVSHNKPAQSKIKHATRNSDRWWEPVAPPPDSLKWQPPLTDLPFDDFLPSQPYKPPPAPQPLLDRAWEDISNKEQNMSSTSLEQHNLLSRPREVMRANQRIQELLDEAQDVVQVENTHLRPALSLLLLPVHDPSGNSIGVLLRWLKSRTVTLDALAALNETVLAKVRANTISRLALRQYYFCLPRLTPWRTDISARQALIDYYISLHNALTRSDMPESDRISAQQALYVAGVDSMQPDYDACLLALDRLSALEEAGCVPYDAAFLPVVLGHILARVPENLSDEQAERLHKAFNKSFEQSGYADTILQSARSYMKIYHKHIVRRPAHTAFIIRTLLASTKLDIARPADIETQKLWTIYDVLKYPSGVKHIAQLLLQVHAGRLSASSLARLLNAIEQHEAGESATQITSALKEAEHESMRALNALLRVRNNESKHKLIALLQTLGTHGIPVAASLQQLIAMLTSGRQTSKADALATLLTEVQLPTQHEQQTQPLKKLSVRSNYSTVWKRYLLDNEHATAAARARQWHQIITSLPPQRGNNAIGVMLTKLKGKPLTRHDCDLLKELCSITAASATLETCRRSFRWIWQCYHFLTSQGQEPGSVVARAMFQAGVMIPLRNHINVSRKRLLYLLDIVERVESFWIAADLRREVEELHKFALAGIVRRQQLQEDRGTVSRTSFVGTGYSIMRTKLKPRIRIRKRGLITFLPAAADKSANSLKYTAS